MRHRYLVCLISYQNLFSTHRHHPEMQSDVQPDEKVLADHVAVEVVCLKM